jgi:hypothetical protein
MVMLLISGTTVQVSEVPLMVKEPRAETSVLVCTEVKALVVMIGSYWLVVTRRKPLPVRPVEALRRKL